MRNPKCLSVCEAIQQKYTIISVINKIEDTRFYYLAKQQILKSQCEQQHTFNKKRKPATEHKIGDLVVIKKKYNFCQHQKFIRNI